jgi:glycosyltransferase involved in cell wall biosynthesis
VSSIACLLPARNAAAELPGYLESAGRFADAVVALDDGSTDATAEILEDSGLVSSLLREPSRPGYAGWDDARNRRRLLAVAADLDPTWVVFLDADERLDADDAGALRDFLLADALPGCAYGLRLHRTWGEGEASESATTVYRVFAHSPGMTLPADRLHFNPVPEQIPRSRWLPTTIRVRHLDSPARLEARRAKYAAADPEGAFADGSAPLLAPPGDLVAWAPRPASLPVLQPDAVASEARPETAGEGPLLACLLPVRNEAAGLPEYLREAARVADFVVALDDGSTDETAATLDRSDLVRTVLRNPSRQSYEGWNDRENRQRLLDSAVELGVRWALFLDADERIDEADAMALRRFVERDADPAEAYGFRVHRMIGDQRHYDAASLWAYRLFAPTAGQELPTERLHLVPVPTSIAAGSWRRTTVRIKHLASLDEPRRAARAAKYAEADPERRWQSSYESLTRPPGDVREWRPRPAGLPVLADPLRVGAAAELDLETLDLGAPTLSAIVIARNDEATIERSLRAVADQECDEPFEVIVAVSGTDRTAAVVRERFSDVTLVDLGERALPGQARNAGLRVARGDYVSFPGSHVELPPGSLEARLRAHRESGCAMVTGTVRNGTTTRSGWASYFLDHGTALPGRPSGPLAGAPAHCSYARDALLAVGGFPEDLRAGEDTAVNQELVARGYRAYRDSRIELTHRSRCRGPARLVSHHFTRGRAHGRLLLAGWPDPRRSLAGLVVRFARQRAIDAEMRVGMWAPELDAECARAAPLIRLAAYASACGALVEIWRPRRRRARLLQGGLRGGDRAGIGVVGGADAGVDVDLDALVPLQVVDRDGDL